MIAVVGIQTATVHYCGRSVLQAARALEPGCCFASGETRAGAICAARAQAKRFGGTGAVQCESKYEPPCDSWEIEQRIAGYRRKKELAEPEAERPPVEIPVFDMSEHRKPIHESAMEERYTVKLVGNCRASERDPYLPYVRE